MDLFWPNPTAGAAQRLVCFPGAGIGASFFARWRDAIPGVEVVGVRLPGRESRLLEPPHKTLSGLVDEVAGGMDGLLDAPWSLFGHSFGALAAFEVARELRRRRHSTPRAFVAAAAQPPQVPRSAPDRLAMLELLSSRAADFGQELGPGLVELMLPPLEADVTAASTYVYGVEAPLDCPILALGGSEDAAVRPPELDGWREHTSAGFRRQLLDGGHFFVETARRQVLREVESVLTST